MMFGGIPIHVSSLAEQVKVEWYVEGPLPKRRKRYRVRSKETRTPCAYLVDLGSIGLGLVGQKELVVHPSLYEAIERQMVAL